MAIRMSERSVRGRLPHLYADTTIYFLTARTVDRAHIFDTKEKKSLFFSVWNRLTREYRIDTYHWILWSNHYHALCFFKDGESVHKFINRLHSTTALLINREDMKKGRPVWYQYWDHCIRNERDFWMHFNYITNNPIKHGWCDSFEEAFAYPFCATTQWIQKKGASFVYQSLTAYPVKNFIPEEQKNVLRDLHDG